jgi:uncharacterized protein YjbJ (UPF0337 family)
MAKSGPREGVEGVLEDLKGKAKETVGGIKGDDNLKQEGRAQQDKAEAQREAAVKEAEADRARAAARVHEAEEAAHQHR